MAPGRLPGAPLPCAHAEPMDAYLYLAPQASCLEACSAAQMPAPLPGCVRVVCISDTHNEHGCLRLPPGDVLVHAGDVLTESGLRHTAGSAAAGGPARITPSGEALLQDFATWFGEQDFAHKVLVGGNHDAVLQHLGRERVQRILSDSAVRGEALYLEDSEATAGRLRIYGSPYAHYSSHNDAFTRSGAAYAIGEGVHVVVTHMPAVLPAGRRGAPVQHEEITRPLLEAGALLHVGGHCHWAHGLHFAEGEGGARIPCVVASVCDSTWLFAGHLASVGGFRGDPMDRANGGYNLVQPGIIVDLHVPAVTGPAAAPPPSPPAGAPAPRSFGGGTAAGKPLVLFFCPNDPGLVEVLLPRLQAASTVHRFESADVAVASVGKHPYLACVSKLGTRGNLGRDVIAALRAVHGRGPFVAVHSATAAGRPSTRAKLDRLLGIDLFAEHGGEAVLMAALLRALMSREAQGSSQSMEARRS